MPLKGILWVGSARDEIREFPDDARQAAGHQLDKVQRGLEPSDWKPMPPIGPGALELRIHDSIEHRVIYIAKFTEAVYVLHAFPKKSRKTTARDIDLARGRFREVLRWRRQNGL